MPTLFSALSNWLQPQHLAPECIAAVRRDFNGRPELYTVLDGVIDPSKLALIRQVIREDGEMKTVYKLYGDGDWVDRKKFEQAPDKHRFIYEEIYQRPQDGRAMSMSVLHDMLFRMLVADKPFQKWLSAITGLEIGPLQAVNLKRLRSEHFLRWHSDTSPGRVLCMVLYLHDDWQPAYGGRLLMQRQEGGIDAIDPLFNRLVVFSPTVATQHAIEPMTEQARDWSRLNYSLWFKGQGES